ncbi:MAG: hypothetical protein IPJ01_07465 [Micavibrio sp.]|nr:hypothetical protein [Micavibrio sp.]
MIGAELISELISNVISNFFKLATSFIGSQKLNGLRKKRLKKLLQDSRFLTGRKLETLTLKIGTTPEECRKLLLEMGAKGIFLKGNIEGWTLGE